MSSAQVDAKRKILYGKTATGEIVAIKVDTSGKLGTTN